MVIYLLTKQGSIYNVVLTLNASPIFPLGGGSERWARSEQTAGGRGVQKWSGSGLGRLQGKTEEDCGE